jgi:hypothetical protein
LVPHTALPQRQQLQRHRPRNAGKHLEFKSFWSDIR